MTKVYALVSDTGIYGDRNVEVIDIFTARDVVEQVMFGLLGRPNGQHRPSGKPSFAVWYMDELSIEEMELRSA